MSWGSSSRFSTSPLGTTNFSSPNFSSIGRHEELWDSFRTRSETKWSPSSFFSRSSASKPKSFQTSDWKSTSRWSTDSSFRSFRESLDSIERLSRLIGGREDTGVSSSWRKKSRWSFPSFSSLKSRLVRDTSEETNQDESVQDHLEPAVNEENKRNEELAEMMVSTCNVCMVYCLIILLYVYG